jgi:hypothetical protein
MAKPWAICVPMAKPWVICVPMAKPWAICVPMAKPWAICVRFRFIRTFCTRGISYPWHFVPMAKPWAICVPVAKPWAICVRFRVIRTFCTRGISYPWQSHGLFAYDSVSYVHSVPTVFRTRGKAVGYLRTLRVLCTCTYSKNHGEAISMYSNLLQNHSKLPNIHKFKAHNSQLRNQNPIFAQN